MRRWRLGMLATVATALLAGCGGGDKGESGKITVSSEPVTIRVGTTASASLTDSLFQETVVEPVKRKHPNITLELIRMGGNSAIKSIDDWMATGVIPDIILHSNGSMGELFAYSPIGTSRNIQAFRIGQGSAAWWTPG